MTFTATLKNQGTIASAAGAHGITGSLVDSTGTTVKTLTGSYSGSLAAGASHQRQPRYLDRGQRQVQRAPWWSAVDTNEVAVKQANNTTDTPFFVGQGANMPYDIYEAEAGSTGGGATVVGPNRTIGDIAGEASGRKAVTLNSTGSYVQWTSRGATNTFVVRFSIPDSSGGGGTNSTLDLYVNGTMVKALDLTSHFAWLYGAETGPGNSPSAGSPGTSTTRRSFMLPATYPAGSVIKLQKDAANGSQYAIDFMNLEQVAPVANPDPAHYVVPAGFAQADVQAALDKVRMDTTGTWTGVYLPAGQYTVTSKLLVYCKAVTGCRCRTVVHPVRRTDEPGEHRRRLGSADRRQWLLVQRLRVVR